jgi:exonuclease SbcD
LHDSDYSCIIFGLNFRFKMMKILHTADIHIREEDDNRWQAFSEVIALAKSEKVDVLAISGDLFDSDVDANKLRPKFREFFSEPDFDTIMIPGNHDANAYLQDLFLGDRVRIVRDYLTPVKIKSVTFWGFPFQDMKSTELMNCLQEMNAKIGRGETHVLLFHGELLDISGIWENYGSEGQRRYLPIKLEFFKSMKWDYILAGHFHTHFEVHLIAESKYFVYPGSPVPVTRKELGPRKVNLFEIGQPPHPRELKTPYFDSIEINLNPFEDIDFTQTIQRQLKNFPDHARLLVNIGGYFDRTKTGLSEEDLHKSIQEWVGERAESIQFEVRDIHEILADDLFRTFEKKLNASSLPNLEKEKIKNLTIRAIMEL